MLRAAQWLSSQHCCLKQEGSGFESRFWVLIPAAVGPFCVEFACSPRVCVGSLWVSGFLPQSKDMQVRLTGDSELPIGVNVSMSL